MKIVRRVVVLIVAVALGWGLMDFTPAAEALQWPKKMNGIAIQNLAAHNVDNLAIMNCDEHSVPYQLHI